MKTDPNTCVHTGGVWAVIHDAIAHPLLALTAYSAPARRFHNWTSQHAWPRTDPLYDHCLRCGQPGHCSAACPLWKKNDGRIQDRN